MSKQTDAQRIAKLEREIEKLKAAQPSQAPPPSTFKPMSDAEHFDMMHQARERAANNFRFSPAIQRKMDEAWSPDDCRDVNRASHAPQGPSVGGIPSSQQLTSVHPGGGARIPPGGGTGWREASPLRPPPGVELCDRLVDRQDDLDMAKRIEEEARLQARR
jgi:hypothetical protein